MQNILDGIKNILKKNYNVDTENLTLESTFRDESIGLDSLTIMDFVVSLEEKFGVTIPDADLEKMNTLGDLVDYIQRKKA